MNRVQKKLYEMAVFIEFLVGSGLAILFHTVLHNEQAAYIIFGTGTLLSLVTWLVREEIGKSRGELMHQYNQVHEIPFALAQITDPECQGKAQELLAGTRRTLSLLEKGFIPMEEAEFYLEGAKQSDGAVQTIRAVDPLTVGWLTRGALINFYAANLRALSREVAITRIFVTGRAEIEDPEVGKVLMTQLRDGIDVRIAFREELPAASDFSGRDTSCSCDFAIYDDQAVTDVFAQPGKFYGRKTTRQAEVARYLHLYHLIEHGAHSVTEEDGRIVISSEISNVAA
jgi:hypothetical protein